MKPGESDAATGTLLAVERLTMRFGGLTAIDSVSFSAAPGAITAVIGPNGAGKTTLFNCLTGFYRPSAGQLRLRARGREYRLDRMQGHNITRRARLARTFQNIRLFPGMTALENLLIAQHNGLMRASGYTFLGLVGWPGYKRAERAAVERARHWLALMGLEGRADDLAGQLPYGAQRRLEIARAMCTDPVLLCLDEPAAGLNPRESAELNQILLRIRREHDCGLLLIEHDMSVVMGISDRVIVLEYGRKIADGTPGEVQRDPNVIRAYLGEEDPP